jgi:hypothetical protein
MIANEKDKKSQNIKGLLQCIYFICASLTALQFVFLLQIFYMAYVEISKML